MKAAILALALMGMTGKAADAGAHGDLLFIQKIQEDIEGVEGLSGVREGTISPDGGFLYFASTGDGSVSVFSRDERTGRLAFVQRLGHGMVPDSAVTSGGPLAMSPDGKHIYGIHHGSNALNVFARNGTSGGIQRAGMTACDSAGIPCIPDFNSLAVSPNGKYVYYADPNPGSIGCFARNALDGSLTFNHEIKDGSDGVAGIKGAGNIALSQDGRNLYASCAGSSALVVFELDQNTGRLAFLHRLEQKQDSIPTLASVGKILLSPDGNHLYASSSWVNSIGIFNRDALTGRLSFHSEMKDGIGAAKAINRPVSMAISRDGKSVCVGSGRLTWEFVEGRVTLGENTVAFFRRDTITGMLTYTHHIAGGMPGVDSLDVPYSVFISPDGAYAYASSYSGGIYVFGISPSISIRETAGYNSPAKKLARRLTLVGTKVLALETLDPGMMGETSGFDLTGKSVPYR